MRGSTEALNKAVRFYRISMRIGITLLSLLFARSIIAQLPKPDVDAMGAYLLIKLTLVIYMYCWYFGCNRDLSVQNDLFRSGQKPTIRETGVIAVFVVAFAFLFYVDNLKVLSSAFVLFLALNVAGWVWLRRLVKPFSDEALRSSRVGGNTIGVVKALIYEEFMFGVWQWWRFGIGLVMVLCLAGSMWGALPTIPSLSREASFACSMALTISVLELWMWWQRIRLKSRWDGLEWLEEHGYELILAQKVPPLARKGLDIEEK